MRQRNGHRLAVLEALADARVETRQPEQAPRRETPDGNDQPGTQQAQLPLPPERTELLLSRGRRPIASASRCPPGVTTRHGRAIERLVELVLVQLQPAPQGLPGPPAPRAALAAFDDARRLSEHVRPLTLAPLEHGERLERVSRLFAGAAQSVVPLARGQ